MPDMAGWRGWRRSPWLLWSAGFPWRRLGGTRTGSRVGGRGRRRLHRSLRGGIPLRRRLIRRTGRAVLAGSCCASVASAGVGASGVGAVVGGVGVVELVVVAGASALVADAVEVVEVGEFV